MKYIVVILTIKRNNIRLNYLLKKIKNDKSDLYKNLVIFYGIDYKSTNVKKYKSKYGIFTPQPVIACAMTHILAWKYISTTDVDYAIILEDDTFMLHELFFDFKDKIENIFNKNKLSFINSPDSTFIKLKKKNEKFTKSILNFGLDTSFVTPQTAKKLFNFYKNFGVTFHIDQELFFVTNYLNINYVNLDKKLVVKDLEGLSSMSEHTKISNLFNKSTIYKNLKTPFFEISDVRIDGLVIFLTIFFLLIILNSKNTNIWYLICFFFGIIINS